MLSKKEKDDITAKISRLSDDEIEDGITKLSKKGEEVSFRLSACIAERQNQNIKKRYGG